MPRAHYNASLAGRLSDSVSLAPLVGALAHLYQEGTSTPITETIYSAASGSSTLANPLTVSADGSISFYLSRPKRLDIVVVATGFASKRFTVQVAEPSSEIEVVSPTGDAATDYAEIFDALVAAGSGKTVRLKPGTYKVDTQLYRTAISDLRLIGAGMGKTFIEEVAGATVPSGANGTLSFNTCSNIEIAHLTIVGQGGIGVAADLARKGVYAPHCPGIYVHHVEAKKILGEAIYASGNSPRTCFERNYVHDCSLVALNINSSDDDSEGSIISFNVVEDVRGAHILTAAKSVSIIGNMLRQPTSRSSDLLNLSSQSRYFVIANNVIWGCDISGAAVALIGVGVANASNARGAVVGNVLIDNTVAGVGAAIGVRNCTGPVLISGNVIRGNGKAMTGTACPGIRLSGAALGEVYIDGNDIGEEGGLQTKGVIVDAGTNAANKIRFGRNNFDCTTPLDLNGVSVGPVEFDGDGSPENVYAAPVASIFHRRNGGAGTCLYVKESGSGNTGWVGK